MRRTAAAGACRVSDHGATWPPEQIRQCRTTSEGIQSHRHATLAPKSGPVPRCLTVIMDARNVSSR